MEFVDEMEFDRLGVFTYSPEEDTPAAVMLRSDSRGRQGRPSGRTDELQQETIAFDLAEDDRAGSACHIEEKVADENAYVGRTYKDAPEM